jgi:hypothetical protein
MIPAPPLHVATSTAPPATLIARAVDRNARLRIATVAP